MTAYFNGEFMPKSEIHVSPDDRGFVFGDGVYEVILAYNGKLFRNKEHFERLARSLRELKINAPDMPALENLPYRLIQKNKLTQGMASVYIQITRGDAVRKHPFPSPDTRPTVYAKASEFKPDETGLKNGVKVILIPDIRWMRCDIKSISLLPNVMAAQQAKEQGAKEAVMVRDGAITEGSHTSFAAVLNGCLTTYPKSHYILPGITRNAVLDLCNTLNIPVKEYPIMQDELKNAEECMLLGTTTEVMPVVKIDDLQIKNGQPGPITQKLQKALKDLICG